MSFIPFVMYSNGSIFTGRVQLYRILYICTKKYSPQRDLGRHLRMHRYRYQPRLCFFDVDLVWRPSFLLNVALVATIIRSGWNFSSAYHSVWTERLPQPFLKHPWRLEDSSATCVGGRVPVSSVTHPANKIRLHLEIVWTDPLYRRASSFSVSTFVLTV